MLDGGMAVVDQIFIYVAMALATTILLRFTFFNDEDRSEMIWAAFAGLIWPLSLLILLLILAVIVLAVLAEWAVGLIRWFTNA